MDEEDKATNENTQNQKGRRRRRRVRTPGNTKNMAGMVVSEPTDIVERSREILGLRSRRVGKRLAILMVFNGLPKRKKEKPREVKIQWNSSAEPGTVGGIQTFVRTAQ